MIVSFATCERNKAFEYIQKVYPSKEVKETDVSKLLDLVDKDIVRVQDPLMYGNRIAVVGGTNYKQSDKPLIDEAIIQLKENKLL